MLVRKGNPAKQGLKRASAQFTANNNVRDSSPKGKSSKTRIETRCWKCGVEFMTLPVRKGNPAKQGLKLDSMVDNDSRF